MNLSLAQADPRWKRLLVSVLLLAGVAAGMEGVLPLNQSPDRPLPQDVGPAGLRQMLKKLSTTARLLHTTAHPDDEDGGMLTLEARGKGTRTLLMTLTRGEGGQNKVGSSLLDSLGVLRTLELLAADRFYGVDQRFSSVADFGFSKNAEETLEKWQGHDIALADIVRVIRTFRPDVLVARFTGTPKDGHGNHQASAILTREAFRAAADPKRFPEQIQGGLSAWQAKKFYMGRLCWDNSGECEKDFTVKINTGKIDPNLKSSYIQFAMAGLRHQQSQGAALWNVEPGDRFSYYKLVDSTIPNTLDAAGHESDFFTGIDTSLPGLAKRLGDDEKNAPFLKSDLEEVAKYIQLAGVAADKDPGSAAPHLLSALRLLDETSHKLAKAGVSGTASFGEVPTALRQKHEECAHAINLALGVSLEAVTPSTAASPGTAMTVKARFHNGSKKALVLHSLTLGAAGWKSNAVSKATFPRLVLPGRDSSEEFSVAVPAGAESSKPYWHRDDPATESVNKIDQPRFATLPFPPAALFAIASYSLDDSPNTVSEPVLSDFKGEQSAVRHWPVPVVPEFSVAVEPATQMARVNGEHSFPVKVRVRSNQEGDGSLRLEVPEKSRVEPSNMPVHFGSGGGTREFDFKVLTSISQEAHASIRAVLDSHGKQFSESFSLITREDLGAYYYFQPATQRLSFVTSMLPDNLHVGYVMGAGDEIPTALEQLGIHVELLPADQLSQSDLAGFSTIVLGIRAYDTQKAVAANNAKLLEYVKNGGTLIVQYNAGVSEFNNGKFTPFPAQMSRARVSVEEAPVTILAPDDGIFHYPNQIDAHDFDGWVQERGLYFMDTWDARFKPLLACNDPGEPSQKGGLLRAQYGKGTYIFTGYAFFRQLPAGVPGAVRLYVNLLSAGHEGLRTGPPN